MTLNRSLFFTITGLLFAVLLIPLVVFNNLFFPFITGKNFSFRIIVELAGFLWVVLMLLDKQYRPKLSWLTISIVSFVVIVGVADYFGANPIKSFLSNFERMEGWITLAHLLLYFLIASTLFKKWILWERFFQTSVAVSVIVCAHGFLQLTGAVPIHQSLSRLDANFGNAAYLAIYMLFHVFITLILLIRWVKKNYFGLPWYQDPVSYIYAIIIVFQASVLFFTATRGSILGLIGGLIVAAILVAITERQNLILRKVSIGILIALVAIVALFISVKNTSFVQHNEVLSRLSSISATDNTTKSRFMIWNMAWKGVTEDPKHFLLGYGQEGFNYVFNKYYDPGMYGQEQWFDRAHDIVFDWLAASGILGLLAYFSVFGMALYFLWKKSNLSNLERSLVTGMLLGYLFHNLFVFDNIMSYIMFFSIMAFIGMPIDESDGNEKHQKHNKNIKQIAPEGENELLQYLGGFAAIAVFFFVFYQYNYKPISANIALIGGITQTQVAATDRSGSPYLIYTQKNFESFKEALSYNTMGLYETREQLFSVAQGAVGGNSDNSVKQAFVSLAKTEAAKQIKETPNDMRYYVLVGSFYQGIGDYVSAEPFLLKARELSPKKQSALFVLGSNYFSLKKYTEALNVFKNAYELDTTNYDAKKLYGLVALYVGQDSITNNLFGTSSPVMDPRFLQAYKSTKHYNMMIAYLEKSAIDNPSDIQIQLSLADGYLIVGGTTKAIAVLQKSKTLTDDIKIQNQIDSWIKDIRNGKNPFEAAVTE